jgi:ribosomal 50S subunit-recycling heat shock protein
MRIDKFLKVSRVIKRRTVANDACDTEHVSVNGRPVKASYNVKEGDVVEITFGQRTLKVRVLDIKEFTKKNEAASLYEVIDQ